MSNKKKSKYKKFHFSRHACFHVLSVFIFRDTIVLQFEQWYLKSRAAGKRHTIAVAGAGADAGAGAGSARAGAGARVSIFLLICWSLQSC